MIYLFLFKWSTCRNNRHFYTNFITKNVHGTTKEIHCIVLFYMEKLIHVQGEIMPKSKQDLETKKRLFYYKYISRILFHEFRSYWTPFFCRIFHKQEVYSFTCWLIFINVRVRELLVCVYSSLVHDHWPTYNEVTSLNEISCDTLKHSSRRNCLEFTIESTLTIVMVSMSYLFFGNYALKIL
jgi:hypothetical protein